MLVLKISRLSNKKYELKQIECIFPKSVLNGLIINKLAEIIKFQDIIKTNYKLNINWYKIYYNYYKYYNYYIIINYNLKCRKFMIYSFIIKIW